MQKVHQHQPLSEIKIFQNRMSFTVRLEGYSSGWIYSFYNVHWIVGCPLNCGIANFKTLKRNTFSILSNTNKNMDFFLLHFCKLNFVERKTLPPFRSWGVYDTDKYSWKKNVWFVYSPWSNFQKKIFQFEIPNKSWSGAVSSLPNHRYLRFF